MIWPEDNSAKNVVVYNHLLFGDNKQGRTITVRCSTDNTAGREGENYEEKEINFGNIAYFSGYDVSMAKVYIIGDLTDTIINDKESYLYIYLKRASWSQITPTRNYNLSRYSFFKEEPQSDPLVNLIGIKPVNEYAGYAGNLDWEASGIIKPYGYYNIPEYIGRWTAYESNVRLGSFWVHFIGELQFHFKDEHDIKEKTLTFDSYESNDKNGDNVQVVLFEGTFGINYKFAVHDNLDREHNDVRVSIENDVDWVTVYKGLGESDWHILVRANNSNDTRTCKIKFTPGLEVYHYEEKSLYVDVVQAGNSQ